MPLLVLVSLGSVLDSRLVINDQTLRVAIDASICVVKKSDCDQDQTEKKRYICAPLGKSWISLGSQYKKCQDVLP
jgi:hypothetical protein